MKCQRNGCPTLLKGQFAWASVFSELREKQASGKKGEPYSKPHLEQWCLECYQAFEAHKYTYVEQLPEEGSLRARCKRVPRTDAEGELIVEIEAPLIQTAPIETGLPKWANQPAAVPPTPGTKKIKRTWKQTQPTTPSPLLKSSQIVIE
jgi:hypothetical protein